jgi:hypothetical protein
MMGYNLMSNSLQKYFNINYWSTNQIIAYVALQHIGVSVKVISVIIMFL